jgi:hypothetical protein
MLAIPPYVPHSFEGISHTDWDVAHRVWARSIQDLLLSDSVGTAISDCLNLPQFLDTFFNAQLSTPESPDIELLRLVFLLYVRACAQLSSDPTLSKSDIFTPDRLLNFATIYAKSNIKVVRKCFHQITTNLKSISDQFALSVDTIAKFYASFANPTALTDTELDQLLAMSTGLDALFATSFDLAQLFESSEEFTTSITRLYDGPLTEAAVKSAKDNDKNKILLVRAIKLTILSMFNSLFDACFFSHFGYVTNLHDWEVLDTNTDANGQQGNMDTIHYLNNKLLNFIEQSGLEKIATSLVDAPLILDVEIEASLGNKISKVNREKFHGEDEQLEFLVLSMEHLRALCSTTESHQRRKQQMKAVKSSLNAPTAVRATPNVNSTTPVLDESYIKMTALISQILDLFPDLGEGFVEACLKHFANDVEQVTNHLLEDTLPTELANMDRSLTRKPMAVQNTIDEQDSQKMKDLSLQDDIHLRSRRNVFDNDEFDVFAGKKVSQQQAHRGKLK